MIELKPAINEVKLTLKSISSPINLGTVMEPVSGGSVPTEVRQAIYTLLENAAYATTGLEDEIAIVQAWAQEVTALSLSPTSLTIEGETPQTLTATVVPDGSTVLWSSSDESVATVSGGVVTGTGNGSCVITATAGNLTATCAVTVSGFTPVVIESISAVYTSSDIICTADTVDGLKKDLVVTATYSDTTTETIPSTDYTLSGSLTAGTSTITVTYLDKSTTFNVTVRQATQLFVGASHANTIVQGKTVLNADGSVTMQVTSSSNWNVCDTPYGDASLFPTFGTLKGHRIRFYLNLTWDNFVTGASVQFTIHTTANTSAYNATRLRNKDLYSITTNEPFNSYYDTVLPNSATDSSYWSGSGSATDSSYVSYRNYLNAGSGGKVTYFMNVYDLGADS